MRVSLGRIRLLTWWLTLLACLPGASAMAAPAASPVIAANSGASSSPATASRVTGADTKGADTNDSDTKDADAVSVADIRRFVGVFEKVKQNFVRPVTDQELFDNALSGLLSRLDPYSDYLDTRSYETLVNFTEGEIAETGLSVTPVVQTDTPWQIGTVPAGSPAARAGLQAGQLLHKIDGKSVRNLVERDIQQLLRGPVGSTVRLSVSQAGRHPQEVRVVRALPEDNAVRVIPQPDGILVVQINAFQAQSGKQIRSSLEPVYRRNQLKGVVLDVRDNPGGLLSAAVEIANFFIAEGMIVSTQGRGEPDQRYQAIPPETFSGIPVVLLQNHYSASASEVLAGALQDHGRAKIVGEPSYGKGSVQKLWPLGDGRAIKLTVAHYYTPHNRLIEGKGIQPDVTALEPVMPAASSVAAVSTPLSAPASTSASTTSVPPANDPMLQTALTVLREQIAALAPPAKPSRR